MEQALRSACLAYLEEKWSCPLDWSDDPQLANSTYFYRPTDEQVLTETVRLMELNMKNSLWLHQQRKVWGRPPGDPPVYPELYHQAKAELDKLPRKPPAIYCPPGLDYGLKERQN
ncbi:hypothetical protein GCM10023187_12400 [Nibrella viscosa]|uniref:Uncharacterized protein n=1 Tax=Nibrella viscosa TaxID=1084524 RepID=A0ABP8K3W9_9BACT